MVLLREGLEAQGVGWALLNQSRAQGPSSLRLRVLTGRARIGVADGTQIPGSSKFWCDYIKM